MQEIGACPTNFLRLIVNNSLRNSSGDSSLLGGFALQRKLPQ